YPSDLTDEQWAVLRPEAEQVMAEMRRAPGRPAVHDLRAMVDAIGYVVRNGIEWRGLPVGFSEWAGGGGVFSRLGPAGAPAGPAAGTDSPAADTVTDRDGS